MILHRVVVWLLADPTVGYDPYECRTCGTSLERERGSCPCCGSADIVHIQI